MYGGRVRFDDADAVVAGLHLHLHHRRHDRRAARRAAGRLPGPQLDVPGRPLPQRDRRRRGVRAVRRPRLLVPQGLRLPPARGLGQGRLLVRLRRLLGDLHAALHPGPAGHDAPAAARQHRGMAADAGPVAGRRRRPDRRRDLPGHPAGGQHPRPREAARRDRRSLGRPLAGMGDALAAAVLQLRRPAERRGRGGLLGHQAARDRDPAAVARAEVRADRDAGEQPGRLLHRLLRHRDRLRADLAHLVAGRRSAWSAPSPASSCSPGATCTSSRCRPRRWRGSTGPAARRAKPCSSGSRQQGALP